MHQDEKIKPQTNDIGMLMLNSSYSTSESESLNKIENIVKLREGGQSAQILYIKHSKKKTKSEPKVVIIKSNNTLILERDRNDTLITSAEPKKQNQTLKNVSNEADKKNSLVSIANNKEKKKAKEQKRKETQDSNQSSINNTNTNNEQTHYSTVKKVKVNNYIETKENNKNEKKPNQVLTTTQIHKQTRNTKPVQPKQEEPKENKQEKRKQYIVPPVKIKKDKSMSIDNNNSNVNNSTNQEEFEQKKNERVQYLVHNQEKLCILNYQREEEMKLNQKGYKEIEKKLKYLEQNDIDVDELVTKEIDDEGNEKEEETNQKKKKHQKEEEVIEAEGNNYKFNTKTEEYPEEEVDEEDLNPDTINQNDINIINGTANDDIVTSEINQYNTKDNQNNFLINKIEAEHNNNSNANNNNKYNKSDFQLTYSNTSNNNIRRSKSSNDKEPKKPKIDTFEYLKKIYQEWDINPSEMNKEVNSFRKSSGPSNKKNDRTEIKTVTKVDSRINFVYDEDDNFVCSYKKSNMENRDDIRKYINNRRKQSKEKAIKVQEEKNIAHIKNLVGLSKLHQIIENSRRAIQSKTKKIKNEYCFGARNIATQSPNKALESTSTVIDLDDVLGNMVESNKIITSGMSDQYVNMKDQNDTSMMNQTNNSLRESMKKKLKDITNDVTPKNKEGNKNRLIDSASSISKLKESLLEKVNNTVKRANDIFCSEGLNQVLRSDSNKGDFGNSINTVSDNVPNEDRVCLDEEILNRRENRNDNYILETGEDETQKNSIQVPSTIYQSNILSINPDKDEKQKKQIRIEKEEEDIDIEQNSHYFSNEELEDYNERFEQFGEWFKMLNIHQSLNIIILYVAKKVKYIRGIKCLIFLLKRNPFNALYVYAKYNRYSNIFRVSFPYLRRVLYELVNHQRYVEQKEATETQTKLNSIQYEKNKQRIESSKKKDELDYDQLIQGQDDQEQEQEYEEEFNIDNDTNTQNTLLLNLDNGINCNKNHQPIPSKQISEEIAKRILDGIRLLTFRSIIYSMQKIAEYAYPNLDNQITEEDKQGEDSQSEGSNVSKRNVKNIRREDKMRTDNCFEYDNNNRSNLSGNNNQTYMYESFESKSSIVLYPNSEKSDRLHRVYELIGLQKDNMNNSFTASNNNEDFNTSAVNYNNLSFNGNNDNASSAKKSSKSTRSLGEIAKMKPGISLKNSMNTLKSKSNRSETSIDNNVNNENLLYENKEINIPLSTSSHNKFNLIKQQPQINNEAVISNQKPNETPQSNLTLTTLNNNTNSNYNIERNFSMSEQDVSVDKDSVQGIDWEYNVAGNKSSSNREELKPKFSKDNITKFILEQTIKEPIKEESLESASRELLNKRNGIDQNMTSKEKIEDEVYNISNDQDKNEEINYEKEFIQINLSDAIDDNDDNDVNSFIDNQSIKQRPDEEISQITKSIKEPIKSSDEKQNEDKNSLNTHFQNIPKTIESEESDLIVIEKQETKFYVIGDNTSLNSKELSMINLNTPNDNRSESSNITAIQNKTFIPNNYKQYNSSSSFNQKRYDEDDLKHHDVIHQEEPIAVDVFADIMASEIIKHILIEEISTNKHKLIPKKTQRIMTHTREHSNTSSLQISNSGSYGGSSSPKRPMLQVNISANSLFNNSSTNDNMPLNNSIFMKTIDDIKKEISLNLYNEKIAPKLIEEIGEEIDNNYLSIYNQIKLPYYCDVEQLIKGLTEKDDRLITLSKNKLSIPPEPFVSKRDMLSSFNKINKNIRNDDNITSDNYYDNILNDCLIDAANEIIGSERIYGEVGLPLPWSNRTKHIQYKYENNAQSKERLVCIVKDELKLNIDFKMGLIPENYDFMDVEQLSLDREKKFMKCIEQELHKSEDQWLNYEIEETQIKLVLSKIILDQLLNEIVEILEHVHFSRNDPNKYQSKSIYACEDIPRLSFQNTTENDYQDHINQ